MTVTPPKSRYWVPMLGHAFAVLEVFYGADVEMGLQQVTAQTKITKSSAFRILFTLEHLGYLVKDPTTGKYSLGRRLFEAAGKARSNRSVVQVAQPHMRSLHAAFGETVNLGALQNREIVYVDVIEGRYAFRMTTDTGSAAPLHASALGKTILAHLPVAAVDALLAEVGMPRLTARTITNRKKLFDALKRARQQGYAMDNEEIEPGAVCVAAPILTATGEAVYGISVSGPSQRMRQHKDEVATAVRQAAASITEELKAGRG